MQYLLEYAGIPIVPVIIGISEILKNLGVNPKFVPVFNLFFGLIAGILLNLDDIKRGAVVGLAVGLSASGLYSGVKNVHEGIREKMVMK